MTDVPSPATPAGDGAAEGVRPTWRAWEAFPVFIISFAAWAVLSAPFASAHPTTAQELAGGIVLEVSVGATVLVWLYARHRSSMRALGIPRRPVRELVVGLLAGLALSALLVYGFGWILAQILQAISGAKHVSTPKQLPTGIAGGNLWLAGLLVLLAAPVCEELFFRGLLFRGLRARLGFGASAVASAAVFGLAHLPEAIPGPWQGAVLLVGVLTFVGFGLAFIYERRGTIVAAIGAHGAFNLVGFLVLLHVIG